MFAIQAIIFFFTIFVRKKILSIISNYPNCFVQQNFVIDCYRLLLFLVDIFCSYFQNVTVL